MDDEPSCMDVSDAIAAERRCCPRCRQKLDGGYCWDCGKWEDEDDDAQALDPAPEA